MSSQPSPEDDELRQLQAVKSRIICDECDDTIELGSSFFLCPGHQSLFDICLACAQSKHETIAAKHARLMTCFVDERDGRRTFIPGPSMDEFVSIITTLSQTPSEQVEMAGMYRPFFRRCKLDGAKQTFRLISSPEPSSTESTAMAARKISNDYSTYHPLDKERKEIRLLLLPPGPPESRLMGVTVPVAYPWVSLGPFASLSYTWGSMHETRRVWITHLHKQDEMQDGSNAFQVAAFRCTANLEMALRGIRSRDHNVLIWVDALCINQGDPDERAYQVAMMAEMYGHAAEVQVWLGTGPGIVSAGASVASLARNVNRMREQEAGSEKYQEDRSFYRSFDFLEHVVGDHGPECHMPSCLAPDAVYPGIARFFENHWFSRVWILQEVWAAKYIKVVCGHRLLSLSWDDILLANAYLFTYGHGSPSGIMGKIDVKTAADMTKLAQIQWNVPGSSLWANLVRTPGEFIRMPALELVRSVFDRCRATDPRDLIFAIWGMTTEASELSDDSALIRPSYTKPPWQVISDFTRWHVMHYKSLNILGPVTYRRRGHIDSLGGQVPSWSLSPEAIMNWSPDAVSARPPFQADANIPLDTTLVGNMPGNRSLTTLGYEIDTIAYVDCGFISPRANADSTELKDKIPYPWHGHIDKNIMVESCGLARLWQTIRAIENVKSCTVEEGVDESCECKKALDSMLDAMTGGRWFGWIRRENIKPGLDQRDLEYKLEDRSWLHTWFASHWVATTDDPNMDKNFCEKLRELLLPLVKAKYKKEFPVDAMVEASNGKAIFRTESGALGLCHPHTQAGDHIVILFGCRVPVVLRQSPSESPRNDPAQASDTCLSTSWCFVGECYLNGVMDGEAVREKIKSNVPVRQFSIL